jgi:predicted ArsR family transcriptional regulator
VCDNERESRAAEEQGFHGAVVRGTLPAATPAGDLENAMLAALADGGPMTADHLATMTGATSNEAAGIMWDLSRRGLVRAGSTSGRGIPRRTWELVEGVGERAGWVLSGE